MQRNRNMKVSSLIARAWGVLCGPRDGGQCVCGATVFLPRQVVTLATLVARAGNSSRVLSSQIPRAANFRRCARCNVHDLSLAGENRRQERSYHLRDFQRNELGKGLWPNSPCRPAWVDAQLATLDLPTGRSASATASWSFSADPPDQLIGSVFDKRLTTESVRKLCQQGQVEGAVGVLEVLVGMDSGIDKNLLYSVLKECMVKKDLMLGSQVHALAVRMGFGSNRFLCNHFIRMYAGHGKLQQAMDVFSGVAVPDGFMWSSIISAHVKQGQAQQAVKLYQHLRTMRMTPDGYVLVAALQACAAAGDLQSGKQIHLDVLTGRMEHDIFVCNCLVDMYAKCGSLKDARRVFDSLREKDVVTWNAIISGYAKVEGMGQEALRLHIAMCNEGLAAPNAVTFVGLLQACANVGVSALEKGKQLHTQLKDQKLESEVVVGGSLVNMYVKCGDLNNARVVFDGLVHKNVVTWNAIIAGYVLQEGMEEQAFSLYNAMRSEGLAAPDAVTFVCLLQACANVGVSALEKGKELYSQIKDRGIESKVVVGCGLVNMYLKCGSLEDARKVFDGLAEKNVVMWTAMIAGYAHQEGQGQEALSLYNVMHSEGVAAPNAVTFICLLQACANVGGSALETGKQLHSQLKDRKLESDLLVGSSLVNMYVKCGSLKDARIIFDGLGKKDVVTWTAMIAGYAQQEGMSQEALNLYSVMQNEGIATPDEVTYACLLEACASVGALQQGKQVHSEIQGQGLESNALIGACLVKMYAKCGSLEVSRDVFDRLPIKNLVTWNALLKEYAEHGEGILAIQCFEELLEQSIQPDEVTYTCLFTACSHAGLVDEGQQYFETMMERHGVEPNDWHYNCMVDLLGRSGHLYRAEKVLRASRLAFNAVSWRVLLSACKSYGDAELGKHCFDQLVNLEPTVATPYVLLASIYANAGRWDEVDRVERLRKAAGAKKMPAKACIEVKKEVHEFTVGQQRSDVAATLRKMNTTIQEGGHVPQIQLVLKTVSEQEKEDALCGHAEKLALAYGLLHTPAGSTLVVTKNLRMCNDCHSSTKVMSRLEKREIVVRDGHKVHRFQNGACSCLDRP